MYLNEVHTFSISANEGYMVEAYRGKNLLK